MSDERLSEDTPERPALVPRRGDAASATVTGPRTGLPLEPQPMLDLDTAPASVAAGDPPVVQGVDVVVDPTEQRPGARGRPARARADADGAELVIDLLDALESLVVNGRRFPFSAAVLVNEDEALDYIDRARAALPDDLKQARVVVDRQRELLTAAESRAADIVASARVEAEAMDAGARVEAERVVASAHAEGDRVVRTAGEHAAALVSAHAVTAAAEQRARDIAAAAATDAAAERAQADAYARDLLGELAGQIEKALGQVHRGLEVLPGSAGSPRVEPQRRQRR